MSTFKCKMCGGALEITDNASVATCEYCGTQQTLPKLDNDRCANLYDRANHFRRNNEFDKAMGIYEQILNEDTTDAEAYWSLVLCRYGIEYVEDPTTHKRVPTVNRAQFTSVFDDDNFKSALQYADGYQRGIYEAEAKTINEIQKGILAISEKEEAFDVFICYKEADSNGRRTPDSVLANDLYHQLTLEGFKVFFARITLEDKLGSAYEPYIFAALNSAKVMVVLGTKPEHFNAVWVKNEWSRYLALIKQGQRKTLIPAYKDMDPYDLPEEFSHLQAQDMSKLGFMQDLIRGIKKIAQADTSKPNAAKETVASGGSADTAPLLKRVFMFLEDGEWDSADEYCEKVLDIDPENVQAYLGKLMAELRANNQDSLKNRARPFDDRNNYQKIMRFGDEKLKETLVGYNEYINNRNEQERMSGIYSDAESAMLSAYSESDYKSAAQLFESIPEYRDSSALAQTCYEKAEIARKDQILYDGKAKMELGSISDYTSAIKLFESIAGWKNADENIRLCQTGIEEIKAKQEADRLEAERQAEIARIEAERRAKKLKKTVIIAAPIICALVAIVLLVTQLIIPNSKYNNAVALMESGQYEKAISAFEAMDGYKDSITQIQNCNTAILDTKYNKAVEMADAGKYEEAIAAFETLGGYKDSVAQIIVCETAIKDSEYNNAVALINTGDVFSAYEAFVALDGYKDSTEKANSLYAKCEVEKLKNAKVGDYVFFGSFEQDNKTSNGAENIEWLVLEKSDDKILLISKYALACKQYNTEYRNTTWESCSLRQWLNNDFINVAFSDDEKELIPTVTVSADDNPKYNTNPGNATQDQVFLLSITEANKYFSSDSARKCKPTDYAVANGAYVYSGNCFWWLRSPGLTQTQAADVNYRCDVSELGCAIIRSNVAVRPALWINLDS